jgi:hypothetical protein
VLNGVLPQFVKTEVARRGIINESLRAQNAKRGAAKARRPLHGWRHRSIFVNDISSLQAARDTHRKQYRFKQFLA